MITPYTLWKVEPWKASQSDVLSPIRDPASLGPVLRQHRGGTHEWCGSQNPARRPCQIRWPDLWHRLLDDADVEPDLDFRRADVANREPDPRRPRSRYLGHGSPRRLRRRDRTDDRHAARARPRRRGCRLGGTLLQGPDRRTHPRWDPPASDPA